MSTLVSMCVRESKMVLAMVLDVVAFSQFEETWLKGERVLVRRGAESVMPAPAVP